jgi:hypothetical protein
MAELSLATKAARTHARALAEIGKRSTVGGDETVADVIAAADRRKA